MGIAASESDDNADAGLALHENTALVIGDAASIARDCAAAAAREIDQRAQIAANAKMVARHPPDCAAQPYAGPSLAIRTR